MLIVRARSLALATLTGLLLSTGSPVEASPIISGSFCQQPASDAPVTSVCGPNYAVTEALSFYTYPDPRALSGGVTTLDYFYYVQSSVDQLITLNMNYLLFAVAETDLTNTGPVWGSTAETSITVQAEGLSFRASLEVHTQPDIGRLIGGGEILHTSFTVQTNRQYNVHLRTSAVVLANGYAAAYADPFFFVEDALSSDATILLSDGMVNAVSPENIPSLLRIPEPSSITLVLVALVGILSLLPHARGARSRS